MERALTAPGPGETTGSGTAAPPGLVAWLRNGARRRWQRLCRPTPADLLLLLVVVAAVVTLEAAYVTEPVPPGPDAGHWIVTSFSFIGRPHPTDFRVQPGLYPPAIFPLIGLLVLITGSPLTTGFVLAGLLLALYGLTSIHLARRYLRTGPGQLLFVGLAVLNGTTLQMLFWAGYPNFLGFSVFSEAMIFLLAFLRSRSTFDGIAFFALAALVYLTHSLTFSIFAAAAAAGVLLVAAQDPRVRSMWRLRGTLVGAAVFVAAVGAYEGLSDLFKVPHAGYLYTNPATYVVDPVGLVFRPFYFAPAFFPQGIRFYLGSDLMVAVLLVLSVGLFLGALLIGRRWPARCSPPLLIAFGWIAAALFAPAAGYLVHIDTDYPRFAYFLPLPVALGSVLLGEALLPARPPPAVPAAGTASWRASWRPSTAGVPPSTIAAWCVVGIAVLGVFGTVTIPTVASSESLYTTPSYDQNFLAAIGYLSHAAPPGAVLTESTEAERWIEAMTARNAYTSSSTWLQFYPEEVLDNDLSYWALNSEYAVADGQAVLGFSGPNATAFDAFPQYVPYLEGIPFPAVRLSQQSLSVSYVAPNGTSVTAPEAAWPAPTFALSGSAPIAWIEYRAPAFTFNETASLGTGGSAAIGITVTPASGVDLTGVALTLRAPENARLAGTGAFAGLEFGGTAFSFHITAPEGALPNPAVLPINGTLSVRPSAVGSFLSPPLAPNALVLNFPAPAQGFALSISLSSPGLSNPAVTLPSTFTTAEFLAQNDVRFLMVETVSGNLPTVALFEQELGFQVVYTNPEWEILEETGA